MVEYAVISWLCRWLLVRAGLVWRLLAGEAVRGEGREDGCMAAAASCRYKRAEGVTGLATRAEGVSSTVMVAAETGEDECA